MRPRQMRSALLLAAMTGAFLPQGDGAFIPEAMPTAGEPPLPPTMDQSVRDRLAEIVPAIDTNPEGRAARRRRERLEKAA